MSENEEFCETKYLKIFVDWLTERLNNDAYYSKPTKRTEEKNNIVAALQDRQSCTTSPTVVTKDRNRQIIGPQENI